MAFHLIKSTNGKKSLFLCVCLIGLSFMPRQDKNHQICLDKKKTKENLFVATKKRRRVKKKKIITEIFRLQLRANNRIKLFFSGVEKNDEYSRENGFPQRERKK